MSYTIEYNRQFIKTKNGYIPCWLSGDNNSTTGWGRNERRSRDWSVFHNWLDVSEDFMLEEMKKFFNDYNQHWKRNNEFLTNEGLLRWVKNGCKQAGTLEEILSVNPYLHSVVCYLYCWGNGGNGKRELHSVVSSNKGLQEWVNKAKATIDELYKSGTYDCIYPVVDFVKEDIKHPNATQTSNKYDKNDKFVLKHKGRYLMGIEGSNSSHWTPDIKDAWILTYGEICELKESHNGTFIGGRLAESTLVPASKVEAKRYALRFSDGIYKGQYIGKSANHRISLSYNTSGAKVYYSKKTAENAITKQYSYIVSKYGNLEIEEF